MDNTFNVQRRRILDVVELVRRNAPRCLKTLRLVLANGDDRLLSLFALLGFRPFTPLNREIARRKYYRDIKVLTHLVESWNRHANTRQDSDRKAQPR